ncbi:phosphatase PAP2 family protein [Alloprevotella sp. OH1205_COT-284]|uniref:phosphatase PAP2 family protein n=1 Tax=Alloprevotella sp. OH1205_COT-284 TaxID=2491043 RepID=UPI000F5E6C2D|nr:phosphatase PAP2 family protein [Alloprevotella sp. OH1205_COT-284]RRD80424.1 phosphatase PAP2 family protein [Alloprevotella sp. OH1205_COT-284]
MDFLLFLDNLDQSITLFLNGSDSLYLDSFAFLATKTFTWILFFASLLYVIFREHDFRSFLLVIFFLILGLFIADQVASSVFKPWVARLRPSHDPLLIDQIDIVNGYRGGTYGFFSSHASNTLFVGTFLSLLFRHRSATLCLILWGVLNCWTRVYLGVHYFGDVLVGALFGIVIALGCYRLYLYLLPKANVRAYASATLDYIPLSFWLTLLLLAIPWQLYF